MRILLWYWGRRGGGAQYALCLARALAARSDVTLELSLADRVEQLAAFRAIGTGLDAVPTFAGLPGAALGLLRAPALRRRLLRQAARMRAEVVLSAMSHVWTPLVAPALPRAGLAFVPAIHDAAPHPGDPALFWDWRLRTELGAARAALTFSRAVEERVARLRPGLPLLRMPLGAHLPGGGAAPRPPDAAPAGQAFVFFGRLRAYKGLDLLRDAFTLLRQRRPEARLRIVGEGDAEACAPGLAGLPGVTLEQRWVPDGEMAALLAGAWAVVLPYREASQSGVLPLALALGVPAVATPVGGLAEQIGEGRGGLLAAAATPAALAEAMERMMEPAQRERSAAEARGTGAVLADWDAQAAALVDGLRGLGLGGGRA
ncbi:glycosyltransferase [Roseomonas sp. OT10]|uniref:glycosyltransferase n=1 Tax=Roseomonas cutis TaxID=2897332 RepID=UPI001E442C31|nr:glycosyltransferase [Roseomonas sp. OT10]UFN48338.1 glycosyltransferase [Roseomonas sp. OT10]